MDLLCAGQRVFWCSSCDLLLLLFITTPQPEASPQRQCPLRGTWSEKPWVNLHYKIHVHAAVHENTSTLLKILVKCMKVLGVFLTSWDFVITGGLHRFILSSALCLTSLFVWNIFVITSHCDVISKQNLYFFLWTTTSFQLYLLCKPTNTLSFNCVSSAFINRDNKLSLILFAAHTLHSIITGNEAQSKTKWAIIYK